MVFFFSRRRRHTRFDCDWSSDVCSSDLLGLAGHGLHDQGAALQLLAHLEKPVRSEERRVGKECRSRWLALHEKDKGNAISAHNYVKPIAPIHNATLYNQLQRSLAYWRGG